jgi:outer membrane receptor for monomeric catechols
MHTSPRNPFQIKAHAQLEWAARNAISALYVTAMIGASAATISAQAVPPDAADQPVSLSPFEVRTSSDTGYGALYSNSASRGNLRYIDVPQTVNLVTSELLEDAAVFDSREFLQFVPNMTPRANTHQPETFFARGFQINNTYVDGYLTAMGTNRDAALYDRVAYVMGPASAAMGRGEAGGLVNYVSKRPTPRPFDRWRVTVGTDNFYRAELDHNRVLGSSGKWAYRIPVYFEEGDDARGSEINQRKKHGIGPSVIWHVGPNTDLALNTAYTKFIGPGSVGSSWWSHPDMWRMEVERGQNVGSNWNPFDFPLIPEDVVHGYPGKGRETDAYEALLLLTHKFNDAISLRKGVRWQQIDSVRRQFATPSGVLDHPSDPNDFLVPITFRHDIHAEELWRTQLDVLFEREVASINHQLIIGYDAYTQDGELLGGNRGGPLLRQSLYNPDYTLPEGFDPETFVTNKNRDRRIREEGIGYFAQYNAMFFDNRLVFTAGWRGDDTKNRNLNRRNNRLDILKDHTSVPRISVRYSPTPRMTVYYLHSVQEDPPRTLAKFANFTVVGNGSLPPDDDPIHDETIVEALGAKLNEVGLKVTFFDEKLTGTVSVFDLFRTNFRINSQEFVSTGPTETDGYTRVRRFLAEGEKVRGFEAQLVGQATERLTLMASMGIMGGKRPDEDGTLFNIESLIDTLKVRGKYNLRGANNNGFDVTWGINYYFKGWTLWQNSLTTFSDDQLTVDVGGSYYWAKGKYSLTLNVKNVGNELIYLSPNSHWSLRRVLLSFAAKF